jgi:hypothetical protein
MKPPKCKLCGAEHWRLEHVWPKQTKETNLKTLTKPRSAAIRNMAPKAKTVLRGTHNPANALPPMAFHNGKRQKIKRQSHRK